VHLDTDIDGLTLRPLGIEDLPQYAALVSRNREHLTSHGDYRDLVRSTREEMETELRAAPVGRFGVWLHEALIGRVDLIPQDRPNAVLGYWLDRDRLGSGFATAACRALLAYGETEMRITDVWAGVTHGNERSVALLERLGFEPVQDMGTYTRFHRALAGDRERSADQQEHQ
jgi:RimJ/RimL family protein N-acetyltransferase